MKSRFEDIQRLFHEVVHLNPAERASRLEQSCGGDLKLRQEVESLLSAHAHVSKLFKIFEDPKAAVQAPDKSYRGARLGRYEVLEEIGRGGMGIVYLARDLQLERLVALKFLPAHLSAESEAKARLVAEARSAAALDHPNIATVYEIGEAEDGQLFIAMAYYEGETLKDKIHRRRLPVNEALELAMQIGQGLSAAHEKEIIHRDIKPGNLLVTKSGVLKILDFGLAKRFDLELTQTGSIAGTLAYMSPEQARGEPVDERTDLWSFGVVLYEMLAGHRPFQAENEIAILHSILNDRPGPPLTRAQEMATELEQIVNKALTKGLAVRYQKVGEMLADLHTLRLAGSIGHTLTKTSNLPVYLTSFIGRDKEILALKRLVASCREVTLTGPPGTGKTRLSVEVARQLVDHFSDGVFFVPLAPVVDSALVPSSIAQTLGVRQSGDATVLQCLIRFLQNKNVLLVLDNFEQLLPAGELIAELLGSCPHLNALVTSRASLSISGEREFPVPPLSVPKDRSSSVEAISAFEAVNLFIQRGQAVDLRFEVDAENAAAIAEICIRLDGLPLAIELAAARVRILSPKAILSRLEHRMDLLKGGPRDLPARHQALREAIAWSYDLLSKEEKKLLRRLSVCVGGHMIEAAEAIADVISPLGTDLFDGLASLVDKNLLRRETQPDGEPRFLMLETIREFGLECLRGSGEEREASRAHKDFFLGLAEGAASQLTGPEQARWLDRLDRENDNLRAAMDWSLNAGQDFDSAVRFGIALWRFWLVRGQLSEGRERLGKLVSLGNTLQPDQRAQVLTAAGTFAHNLGDYSAARSYYEQALVIYRDLGNRQGIAETLNHLGWVAWRQGDYFRARSLSEEALSLHRELANKRGVAHALNNLGWVAQHQGDYLAACSLHRESLALRREISDTRGIGFALTNLAWSLVSLGEYEEAAKLLSEALDLHREVGERQLLAWANTILALVRRAQGRDDDACRLLEDTISQFRHIGDKYGLAFALHLAAQVFCDRGELDRAAVPSSDSLAIRQEVGDKWGTAQSLSLLAKIAYSKGEHEKAVDFVTRSLSIRRELGYQPGIAECLEELSRLGVSAK